MASTMRTRAVDRITGARRMRNRSIFTAGQVLATAALSLISIHLAGGSPTMLAMQAAAFALAALLSTRPTWPALVARAAPHWMIGAVLLLAATVLFFGTGTMGAHRWLRVGPLLLHPASLAGSILLLALVRARDDAVSMLLAGATLVLFGLGADGAASVAFACGVTGLAVGERTRWRSVLPLCILAWGLAVWGLSRPDSLPAVPYVETILAHTFSAAPLLAIADGVALVLLPLPFLLAARDRHTRGAGYAVAGFWIGLTLAGVLANYPIPVIGYGASPVLGWLVALGALPRVGVARPAD